MSQELHFRCVVLPGGEERDIFVRNGRISFVSDQDARTVIDHGYAIPGLVDAHAHLPFASPGPPDGSLGDKAEASARKQLSEGVLLVRDPGGPTPPHLTGTSDLPRIITAGRFLAKPGRMFPDHGQIEVPEEQVPEAAEQQLKAGVSWVKLIGDFPVPGEGFKTSFATETIMEVVRRIHALDARVAIHAITEQTIESAVDAGVDTIEHGLMVSADQAAIMAKNGSALVPTMVSTGAWLPGVLERMGAPDEQIKHTAVAVMRHAQTVHAAWETGVTILAGTDAGLVPHGMARDEVRLLSEAGIPPTAALAAGSWGARKYLGVPGIEEGAPADLVVFARNPLENPAALAEPAVIVRDAQIVLSPQGAR